MRFSTFRDIGIVVMAGAVTAAVIEDLRPARVSKTAPGAVLPAAQNCTGRYGGLYTISRGYEGRTDLSYVRPAGRDEWRASVIAADLSGSPVFGVQRDNHCGDDLARIILPGQQAWASALTRLYDTTYFQVLSGPLEDPQPQLIDADVPLIEALIEQDRRPWSLPDTDAADAVGAAGVEDVTWTETADVAR
jgi:hypothetical protein